jgi:HAD superfamily hydrolase (TIGR01549 family)
MIKAVIFDCFGVLAEDGWMPLKRKYVGDNQQLAQEIADLGKQNEFGIIDNETHLHQMAQLMHIDPEELRSALGVKVANKELFDFITDRLKPRYKVGLMSNANYDVMSELFTPKQAALFDATVMSFESRLVKPDERMFRLIADRLQVEPEECIFVDDQERYATAAGMLGMYGVYFTSNKQGIAAIEAILAS